MQPGEAGQRAAAIVDLFQNALIYTTVLRNIDNLVQDKEHAILIIISTTAIASALTFAAQVYIADHIHNAAHPYGYMRALVELGQFLLECVGNIAIQLTSSLAATLAINVFASARSVLWGFTGAFVALTLLWLLRKTATA